MDENQGSCILENGTCLHRQSFSRYLFGGTVSLSTIVLGVYLMFFDRTQEKIYEKQKELSLAIKEAKEQENQKDKFRAFLAGFDDDESKVIEAIHEQEGIQQSTLRYRTGLSKTGLSLILKKLEERGFVSKEAFGKTNKLYLKKAF